MERIPKPWGHEIIFAHTDRYAGKILRINKGASLSYQYHRSKDETMYVQQGRVTILVGDKAEIYGPGSSIHIPAGVKHRVIAEAETIIFEVSTPELDDVVRLSDNYGRKQGGTDA